MPTKQTECASEACGLKERPVKLPCTSINSSQTEVSRATLASFTRRLPGRDQTWSRSQLPLSQHHELPRVFAMAENAQLPPYSETRFDHRVADGFPISNPTVDLSISWDAADKNLLIVRPKDQVVSKIHQFAKPGESAPVPQAVRWKPDGKKPLAGWRFQITD